MIIKQLKLPLLIHYTFTFNIKYPLFCRNVKSEISFWYYLYVLLATLNPAARPILILHHIIPIIGGRFRVIQ